VHDASNYTLLQHNASRPVIIVAVANGSSTGDDGWAGRERASRIVACS